MADRRLLHPHASPEEVRQCALDVMLDADQTSNGSRFYRYDRMLEALHDIGWRPLHNETLAAYLRWCEWPDCLRSFHILDGPKPERDGKGWIYVRTGTDVLLCPDHANAGHRPQRFEWQPGDKTIGTSCECGASVHGLTPTSNERCKTWWREHVRFEEIEPSPVSTQEEKKEGETE